MPVLTLTASEGRKHQACSGWKAAVETLNGHVCLTSPAPVRAQGPVEKYHFRTQCCLTHFPDHWGNPSSSLQPRSPGYVENISLFVECNVAGVIYCTK